ncbi:MAG: histidine phosphatase family protein [Cellvibrionaceae bacterium]|nr:histidine phosphatase family protein [Cellvibrionaceae bacterium]
MSLRSLTVYRYINVSRLSSPLCYINLIVFAMVAVLSAQVKAAGDASIIAGLKAGKYSILMRHALAPGTGDPENFQIGDCGSQRNLSEKGRRQAQVIGETLRSRGITSPKVYTSQWCRCRDTAQLLDFKSVADLPIINSFFRDFRRREQQTEATLKWLYKHTAQKSRSGGAPLILVTHQVNITALTGVFPSSGEMVVVALNQAGKLELIARWPTSV